MAYLESMNYLYTCLPAQALRRRKRALGAAFHCAERAGIIVHTVLSAVDGKDCHCGIFTTSDRAKRVMYALQPQGKAQSFPASPLNEGIFISPSLRCGLTLQHMMPEDDKEAAV